MSGYSATRPISKSETFDLWSKVYDDQPNPLLTLEERVLSALLPDIAGKDVLDLGCGTGRWLTRLAQLSPKSLTGVDFSAAMLDRAARKLVTSAQLLRTDCVDTTLPAESVDVALASFLMAHTSDPQRLASHLATIVRPAGTIFVSDLHPGTVSALNWKRSFRSHSDVVQLGTNNWDIDFLISTFENVGFKVSARVEARFGAAELESLERAGRSSAAEAAKMRPAIFLLQFRKAESLNPIPRSPRVQLLTGANVAMGALDTVNVSIAVRHCRIESISSDPATSSDGTVNLTDFTLLPGLVNAHDHLEFALFPRIGTGPYRNAAEWYSDIHANQKILIDKHRAIPKSARIWWGGLRNLISGVTTVCHHNPVSGDMLAEDFPVRVVREYGWSHSLPLDRQLARRHKRTTADAPFVLHLGEGLDETSREEFYRLEESGALDDRTVLVHGLACDSEIAKRLNRHRAALVWCPSSNVFLFDRTHDSTSLSRFDNVAIGSDSPLTSTGDFLDEVRFARRCTDIADEQLFRLVTTEAARILRLRNGEGRIRVGAIADLIAVPATSKQPAEALASSNYRDVHLVLRGGRVMLASPELLERIPPHLSSGLRPMEIDGTTRWVRAPLGRMFRSIAPVLGDKVLLNGRRVRNVASDWF